MVALNCRSFAPSPDYQVAARDSSSRSSLDVTCPSNQRAMRSPTHWQYGEGVPWSFEIVENLERFRNLCVIFAQGPCQSSLYRCNFDICFSVFYIWINKSLSLARQPLLVVALNCRLFSSSPSYQVAARDACSRCSLEVISASNQRSMGSPTHWQHGEGVPWSLEIVENLERLTNLCVILAQGPC